MQRSEFENMLLQETPYYKHLKRTYRDTVNFSRYLRVLKNIVGTNSIIEVLEQNGGKELVYFSREIFSLQEEFITSYIKFLSDQDTIDQWEKFFERYSKNLLEICELLLAKSSNKMTVFEIANRKLLRDLLTKHTMNEPLEHKAFVSERLGVVVNQLFNYIRHSLTRSQSAEDTLIANSYEKLPFLPRCNRSEAMKLLSEYFLKKGLPEYLYNAVTANTVTNYYLETKAEVIDQIRKVPILTRKNITEIFKTYFFFPDKQCLSEILELLHAKTRDQTKIIKKKQVEIHQKIAAIMQKIKDTTGSMREELVNLAESFSTEESIDRTIKRLRRNLIGDAYDLRTLKSKYQEYTNKVNELKIISALKRSDLRKLIAKDEWGPYIILTLRDTETLNDSRLQQILKDAVKAMKNDKAAMEVMDKYRTPGLLKGGYKTKEIKKRVRTIKEEIVLPLITSFLIEELVDYYPKLSGVMSSEGIRYLAEEARSGRVSMIEKDTSIEPHREDFPGLNISRYKNLISVFIYDIRGSTFMGAKLRNAKRESEIRNYFQEIMLSVIEKHGGIPMKDTGDGGIAIFAANHYDLKANKTMKPEGGSTLSAVRAGSEMVQEARNFVRENIDRYQDWFREAEKRKIDFEGATYATLLPSYQSIFQIGVGIASGSYPKEIYLEKNAYGELDVTGMLVREADFYSKVKSKAKSTVIVDDATVYNLLLNVNKFSFLSETGLRIDPSLMDIEQKLAYCINQKAARQGFILDLYRLFATQIGKEISLPGNPKIMLGDFAIKIDEAGEAKDEKGGRGKFLFEISSEVAK